MNPHIAMAAFVQVARAGGFSPPARRLSMPTTAVSRHVAELERMLGVIQSRNRSLNWRLSSSKKNAKRT